MLTVEKVQYLSKWKWFEKGASFFIPCLNPVKSKKVIVKETKKRKSAVTTKVVIEDDVRGIRVGRV